MDTKDHEYFKDYLKRVIAKLKELVRINDDTDVEATIQNITKSIEFKGVNIWILAFAIIVASVGLNVNSTAVIIGAMLISPLMGPINGVGLAIGISDSELLRKSLQNLIIMVVISLLASFSYFFLSPLSDAQSELLARTRPTIFDVLIAFFGGAAGIVATSRKSQPFTIISGVAIATALMPPLCTAGFGLASGQFNYFLGAFYLFFLNSFFIALSTFLIVRYLHFPQKKYLDSSKLKLVKRYITVFSIIVIVPSIFMAVNVVRETSFNSTIIHYINKIQEIPFFDETQLVNYKKEYSPKKQTITISLVGKELSEKEISTLQKMLNDDFDLKYAKLVVRQTGGELNVGVQSEILENIIEKKDILLLQKDSVINDLNDKLNNCNVDASIYAQIAKELSVQYPDLKTFAISNTIFFNQKTLKKDTIPTLLIEWDGNPDPEVQNQLVKWLKVRLNISELKVVN